MKRQRLRCRLDEQLAAPQQSFEHWDRLRSPKARHQLDHSTTEHSRRQTRQQPRIGARGMCNQPVGGLLPLVRVGSTAKGTLQQHDPCFQLLIMDVDLLGHGPYLSNVMEVAHNRKREQYRQRVADKSHGAVILATSAAAQVAPSALSKIANAAGVMRG